MNHETAKTLLNVDSIIHNATKLKDYWERGIRLQITEDERLYLHDTIKGADDPVEIAKKQCKDRIVESLCTLRYELTLIVQTELNEISSGDMQVALNS